MFSFITQVKDGTDFLRVPGMQKKAIELGISPDRAPSKEVLAKLPIFKVPVSGITTTGYAVRGYCAFLPLTAAQVFDLVANTRQCEFMDMIYRALDELADLGCSIVGLGSLTGSALTGNGKRIEKRGVPVALTSGNTYAAVATALTVEKVCHQLDLNLANKRVVVVGATGSVGQGVTLALAGKTGELIIVARTEGKMIELCERTGMGDRASWNTDVRAACAEADIVVVTTAATEHIVMSDMLKPGTILIDETQPPNCDPAIQEREDILDVEAGLISAPDIDFGVPNMHCPSGTIYACYAQTIGLDLQGIAYNYDLGKVGTTDLMGFAKQMEKLGLPLAPLYSLDEVLITPQRLEAFAKIVRSRE